MIRVEPRLGASMELPGAHACNVHEEKPTGNGWRPTFGRVLLLLKDVDGHLEGHTGWVTSRDRAEGPMAGPSAVLFVCASPTTTLCAPASSPICAVKPSPFCRAAGDADTARYTAMAATTIPANTSLFRAIVVSLYAAQTER